METLTEFYNYLKKHVTAVITIFAAILAGIFFSSSRRRDKLVSSIERSKTVAEEHMELMQGDIRQAQEANKLADTIHAGTVEISEDITGPHDPVKPGKVRKVFKAK